MSDQPAEPAAEAPSEILGAVNVKIETEDGVTKGITWVWDPPEANVAMIMRDALDPLLVTHNDFLAREFRKQRRLSDYSTATDYVAAEVVDDKENDSPNGSGG